MGSAAASTVTTDRSVRKEFTAIHLDELRELEAELPDALADAIRELEAAECPSLARAVRMCARKAGFILPKGGK